MGQNVITSFPFRFAKKKFSKKFWLTAEMRAGTGLAILRRMETPGARQRRQRTSGGQGMRGGARRPGRVAVAGRAALGMRLALTVEGSVGGWPSKPGTRRTRSWPACWSMRWRSSHWSMGPFVRGGGRAAPDFGGGGERVGFEKSPGHPLHKALGWKKNFLIRPKMALLGHFWAKCCQRMSMNFVTKSRKQKKPF